MLRLATTCPSLSRPGCPLKPAARTSSSQYSRSRYARWLPGPRADEAAPREPGAAPRGDVPAVRFRVPARRGHPRAEADVAVKVILLGDLAQVVPDLRLRGVGPGPPRILLEGKGVHVRLDVT